MAYKIMYDDEYECEDGARETIPVEYDGVLYESRIVAWRAYWDSKPCNKSVDHVYVKEV